MVEVDLKDGEKPVQVEVEFLAPKAVKLKKNKPKLLQDFRVLQIDACSEAFHNPDELTISGENVRGAKNTVRLRVASLADFLVMRRTPSVAETSRRIPTTSATVWNTSRQE